MVLVSFLALGALILGLLWGAQGVDHIARDTQQSVVAKGLETRFSELEALVVPQADWDDAVAHLDNRFDPAWAAANVGAFLTQTSGFELASVFDASDRPIFSVSGDAPLSEGAAKALQAASAPLIERIRLAEARRGPFRKAGVSRRMISKPIQASGVGRLDSKVFRFTATLVQPDFGTALPRGARAPVIVVGEAIDGAFLAKMVGRYRLRDGRLAPATAPSGKPFASATISDAAGQPLLSLRWTPEKPGERLLRQTFGIAVGAIMLFALCLLLIHRIAQRALFDLVRSKEQLAEALTAAQGAVVAKSEFLASMSHEIRTPLNGVIGALHLLETEPLSKQGATLLSRALGSGKMVNELINDILDLSRIEAGQMSLSPLATDLPHLVRTVADAFVAPCEDKGVRLDVELANDLGWGEVDPLRLRQCLFNLIGNAVKFTETGAIRVAMARVPASDRVLIQVLDTGIGISEAAQAVLFQRFTQADSSISRRHGGAGLGLAITRHLAELMGGGVSLVSRPGEGATFSLEFRAPQVVEGEACAATKALADPLTDVRILLVDDNATNRLIGSTMLARLGADVSLASSGNEALEAARVALFDLILMDIQMPEMDGLEATRRLGSELGPNAKTPIIALTANALPHQRDAYLAGGMQGVIAKPISPQALMAEISRIIGDQGDGEPAAHAPSASVSEGSR